MEHEVETQRVKAQDNQIVAVVDLADEGSAELMGILANISDEEMDEPIENGDMAIITEQEVTPKGKEQEASKEQPKVEDKVAPEGSKTTEVDLHDGQLDYEETYIQEHMNAGTYINKADIVAIAREYDRSVDNMIKSGKDPDVAEAIAGNTRDVNLQALCKKAEKYDEKTIAEAQFKAGEKGQNLEYYHAEVARDEQGRVIKDDKGHPQNKLMLTNVGKDHTKKVYRERIENHKQFAQKSENVASNQTRKMGNNAATFAKGDAESMAHGTMYLTANALMFIFAKLMKKGNEYIAQFEEWRAKNKIDFSPNTEWQKQQEAKQKNVEKEDSGKEIQKGADVEETVQDVLEENNKEPASEPYKAENDNQQQKAEEKVEDVQLNDDKKEAPSEDDLEEVEELEEIEEVEEEAVEEVTFDEDLDTEGKVNDEVEEDSVEEALSAGEDLEPQGTIEDVVEEVEETLEDTLDDALDSLNL